MKARLLTLALLASAAGTALAKSDVDVHFIKTADVQIAEGAITIKGSAITRLTTVSGSNDPGYAGFTIWGKPADSTKVESREATFVILKPKEEFQAAAWGETVANAKRLKAGEKIGRIGYHTPEVTIKAARITAITGYGYLYPNPESTVPTGVDPWPQDAPAWGGTWWTRFDNGVSQRMVLAGNTCRGGNNHGWSSKGKLDHDDGRIIITYEDDRLERWTPIGHRMVVEHWHPASAYPDTKPVVGIAERTSSK